jgi:hypothetical protein
MGIDATGYFVTKRPLTDDEIVRVLDDLQATYGELVSRISFHSLRGHPDFNPRCVEISFDLDRLYSLGYARGSFVRHASVCGWLRRRPYVEAVYYGGDSCDLNEISEWTEQAEQELFNLYLDSNQMTYRTSVRDWFPG